MHILVVDDNELNRLLAVEVLREEGWTVSEAGGGLEAMVKLESEPFDAILLDVGMPHLCGDDLCQWIRADERLRKMPVIAYTAHVLPDEVKAMMAKGFDHVIGKPVSCADLAREVNRFRPARAA
jgi:CheY-like chemotaxis protein